MDLNEDDITSTVRRYYDRYDEASRLDVGSFKLEFVRTCDILARCLPEAPADVYDIGGGPGAYAAWLADRGYAVDLLDMVERHVDRANATRISGNGAVRARVGDSRWLPYADASANAVLLLGPLYHLPEREDRMLTLRECFRVLRPGGRLIAAAISRYASTLAGLFEGAFADPVFRAIAARDRTTGQHRNDDEALSYFTTRFFHHPDELHAEVAAAGFRVDELCSVEGPAAFLPDFDDAWADPVRRSWIVETARAFESEARALAVGNHFVAVGTRVRAR